MCFARLEMGQTRINIILIEFWSILHRQDRFKYFTGYQIAAAFSSRVLFLCVEAPFLCNSGRLMYKGRFRFNVQKPHQVCWDCAVNQRRS